MDRGCEYLIITKHVTPLGFLFFNKLLVYKHFTPIGVARSAKDQLLGIAPALIDEQEMQKMTRKEAVNKNLDLSFEFDRYLFEHPKFAEKIPDNAVVVLLPEYDHELREYNLQIAKKNREPNQPLVFVEIASLRPQKSRLVRPKLKVASDLKSLWPVARRNSNSRKLKKKAVAL